MLLDDDDFIEDDTRRSLKILLEERSKLMTAVLLLMAALVLYNVYSFGRHEGHLVQYGLIVILIQLVGVALIALILNLFVNIIPYKNFTYQERFIRTYLILLMIGYILAIIILLKI